MNTAPNCVPSASSNACNHRSMYAESYTGFFMSTALISSMSRARPAITLWIMRSSSATKVTGVPCTSIFLARASASRSYGENEKMKSTRIPLRSSIVGPQCSRECLQLPQMLHAESQRDIYVSRQPWLAIQEHCLATNDHVRDVRIVQCAGDAFKEFLKHD